MNIDPIIMSLMSTLLFHALMLLSTFILLLAQCRLCMAQFFHTFHYLIRTISLRENVR